MSTAENGLVSIPAIVNGKVEKIYDIQPFHDEWKKVRREILSIYDEHYVEGASSSLVPVHGRLCRLFEREAYLLQLLHKWNDACKAAVEKDCAAIVEAIQANRASFEV